jgi:FkbM family methyltransferase
MLLTACARAPAIPGRGRAFRLLSQLFPHATVRPRHLDGVRLSGPPGDLTYMFAAFLRGADLVGRTIRSFTQSGTFIDIGANIGAYSLLAARTFSHVYAIEPHPRTFSFLARNVDLNGAHNVSLCCAAVSLVGQHMLGLGFNRGHSGGATLTGEARTSTVDVLTINHSWFSALPVRPPILVKVDVEGAEPTVVGEILRSSLAPSIDAMLIELSHGDPAQLLDSLARAGLHEVSREPGGAADDVLFRRDP